VDQPACPSISFNLTCHPKKKQIGLYITASYTSVNNSKKDKMKLKNKEQEKPLIYKWQIIYYQFTSMVTYKQLEQ